MIKEGIYQRKENIMYIQKKVSILIFIWSAFLFFLGLQYKFSDEYNLLLFWIPIFLMIGIVAYQIFFLTNRSYILFEIFVIYLVLHLVFVIGYYGLRGSDSNIDFYIAKQILSNNNFYLDTGSKGYPLLHIFSSIISVFTRIDLLVIAKFLPSFISSLIVFPIYLIGFKLYGDKRVALFSCLIFGTIPQFTSFEASFVKEVFGLFIMVLFFYLLGASIRAKYRNFYVIVFILIPVAILSHHLSSFMLLCLVIIYLIISFVLLYFNKILNVIKIKIKIMKSFPKKLNRNILLVVFIFIISLLVYWNFVLKYGIFELLLNTVLDAFGQQTTTTGATYAEYMNLGATPITTRGQIVYYGFFFYTFLFAILLLIKIFLKNIINKIEDTTFIVFFFLSNAIGFASLYMLNGSVFPDRLITFAYLFGLIPITSIMLIMKKNIGKQLVAVLLISFMIFNFYNIDPHNYTSDASYTGGAATEKEYLLAQQLSIPNNINDDNKFYGYIAVLCAIADIKNEEPKFVRNAIQNINIVTFRNSSSTAIINEAIYDIDLMNYKNNKKTEAIASIVRLFNYKNDINVNKIGDFGRIYVIKGGL
ncbi:MAG: hypothetical protein ACFFBP_19655 [Promethearchaeota archaeon]